MMLKFITLCLGVGLLCACSSEKRELYSVPEIEIEEGRDIIFALDDSTVQDMEYLQLVQRNDSDILAFTNKYDNAIVFYDYKSRQYLSRTAFYKEGNNGIGSIFSFCYLNQDSIYLYNFTSYSLYLANEKGEIQMKRDLSIVPALSIDSLFFAPQLFPRTCSPLRKVGDEILLAGFYMNEQEGENFMNRPVMVYYTLTDNTVRFSDSYPLIYHKGNWGGDFTYRNPYYTLSPENEIVLSFAADDNIRVHGVKEPFYSKFYAGIGGNNAFYPIDEDISPNAISFERLCQHYINSLSYNAILYDKYRKVYYRLAFLPDSDIDISARPIRKPIEIVVLDEQFEVIGKSAIPKERYMVNQCFVGPEGLHIQVEAEDDDELRFKTFVFNGN